jgi:hypothetical protein
LADDGDKLPSFMDILSPARPVVPQVTPPVINLIIDPSDIEFIAQVTQHNRR